MRSRFLDTFFFFFFQAELIKGAKHFRALSSKFLSFG